MTPHELAEENRQLVAAGTKQEPLPDYVPRLRVLPNFWRDVVPLMQHFQERYEQHDRTFREMEK